MLFEKAGRGFKFFLLNLSDEESNEISKLIKDNGGEISDKRDPPVITFANRVVDTIEEPVFHVNYIRECIRHMEVLDLIDFKLGPKRFYGCLMSIFTRGKSRCRYIEDIDPCCTSTETESSTKHWRPVNADHNYALGDPNEDSEILSGSGLALSVWASPASPEFADSQFSPDQSLSSATTIPNDMDRAIQPTDRNFATEVPESLRLSELNLDQSCSSPDESENVAGKFFIENIIVQQEVEVSNDVEIQPQFTSIPEDTNECHVLGVEEEEVEICRNSTEHGARDDEITKIPEDLRYRRVSGSSKSERSDSPILKSQATKVRKQYQNRVTSDVESTSRPTILRDKSNNVKILPAAGGLKDSLKSLENFRLTSSDSDDTFYESTRISDVENQKNTEADEDAEKEKEFRKRIEMPGPSRVRITSKSDDEEPEIIEIPKKNTAINATPSKQPLNISRNMYGWITSTRISNNEKTSADSSTKSVDDSISICDSDTDSSSTEDTASSSTGRTACHKSSSKNSADPKQSRKMKKVRTIPLSRNFLPWEQREMVKYLIDNHCISEAKGNRVWKQLISDGLLPHRTYQSLNNHFRKFILPTIHRYQMGRDHAKQFRKLQ